MEVSMRYSLFILLVSSLFVSCGGYNEGIVQKEGKGFLKFVGNINAITVSIDEGKEFLLDPAIEVYQVKPGKHAVRMYRDNQLVLNRVVIVDNQTTMEIQIP
jgi:hypothetical protein